MGQVNFMQIAIQVGDAVKYDTSVNEIDRHGKAILMVAKSSYQNDSITSSRASLVYDWILSLGYSSLDNSEKIKRLVTFCLELSEGNSYEKVLKILEKNNCPYNLVYQSNIAEFSSRNFHSEVTKHSKKLFEQGNFFHAVFKSAKAFNNDVKSKAHSEKDGQPLMLEVWGCKNGVLKVTQCSCETDRNYQDGIKFLSSGLMSAIRNPTAHEPAITWPIDKQDCLDILSLISFLYRRLDKAAYFQL